VATGRGHGGGRRPGVQVARGARVRRGAALHRRLRLRARRHVGGRPPTRGAATPPRPRSASLFAARRRRSDAPDLPRSASNGARGARARYSFSQRVLNEYSKRRYNTPFSKRRYDTPWGLKAFSDGACVSAGDGYARRRVPRVVGRGRSQRRDPTRRVHAAGRAGPNPPPLSPSRTDWTRLVPPPVLTGHVSSLLPPKRLVAPWEQDGVGIPTTLMQCLISESANPRPPRRPASGGRRWVSTWRPNARPRATHGV